MERQDVTQAHRALEKSFTVGEVKPRATNDGVGCGHALPGNEEESTPEYTVEQAFSEAHELEHVRLREQQPARRLVLGQKESVRKYESEDAATREDSHSQLDEEIEAVELTGREREAGSAVVMPRGWECSTPWRVRDHDVRTMASGLNDVSRQCVATHGNQSGADATARRDERVVVDVNREQPTRTGGRCDAQRI
jgi:hypothetical protein